MAEATPGKNGIEVFCEQIGSYFLGQHMRLIKRAYTFSHYGHKGQTRVSGEKYFSHPKAVALIIVLELHIFDWMAVVGGLLHDIIEDTWLLDEETISINFGEDVALDVMLVTKPDPDYFGRMRLYRRWRSFILKAADRLHNMRTVGEFREEKRRAYIIETREQIIPLLDDLAQVIPAEYAHAVPYLRAQLHAECDKWD